MDPEKISHYLVTQEDYPSIEKSGKEDLRTLLHLLPDYVTDTRFQNKTSSPIPVTYHLNWVPIASCENCKDLGITFSSNLSWSQHYAAITAKAYRQLGLIRRTFSSSASVKVKKTLYLTLIRSQLTYCSQVWKPHLIKDITCLENIKQPATKFILNDYHTDYRSRLISLNLLPSVYFLVLLDILFFIKCLKSWDPSFPILSFVFSLLLLLGLHRTPNFFINIATSHLHNIHILTDLFELRISFCQLTSPSHFLKLSYS